MKTAIVRLPPEMLGALKKASRARGRGERGMGEEVRQRLEASLAADRTAAESLYLGALVASVAESASEYFGSWSQSPFAHQVLLNAIETLLETMKPNGDAKPTFNPDSIADVLFDPADGPEKIGRSLAGVALATTPTIKRGRKQ